MTYTPAGKEKGAYVKRGGTAGAEKAAAGPGRDPSDAASSKEEDAAEQRKDTSISAWALLGCGQ